MSIRENYEIIRERMQAACSRAGRAEDEVRLVAVSKYVETARIQEAVDLGLRDFGENHAQEVREKQTFFEIHTCFVHFIGQLQTNKIKYICGSVGLIESVDRAQLAEALQKRAAAMGICQDVLIQVNIGGEAQKGGAADADLDAFVETVAAYPNLRVRGLMCVPPALTPEETRPYFRRMRALYERARAMHAGLSIDTLSMGMSHDYEVAIEEGATQIRLGTALFGARDRM